MKLIQELKTVTETLQSYDGPSGTPHEFERFKKRISMLEERFELMDPLFQEGGQFAKLVEKLGGDVKILKQAAKALAALEDAVQELDMSTSIAYENENGEDK